MENDATATMFAAIQTQLASLPQIAKDAANAASDAKLARKAGEKTNGHVADLYTKVDALEKVNDVKIGEATATSRIARAAGTFALVFGGLFGGVIAVEFGKVVGIYHG